MPKSRKPPKAAEADPARSSGKAPSSPPASREAALTEEIDSLLALGGAKDEFLKKIAHDLRARLSAICIWVTVMRQSNRDPEKIAQGMDVIEASSRRLAELLDELQDVMSILSGELDLETQPLSIASLVEAATIGSRPAAEAKRIRMETRLDPSASLVFGDAARLRQAVDYLLSNAIKATPEDGLIALRLEATGGHARLVVTDGGQGVSEEVVPLALHRRPRPRKEGRRGGEDSGLGLAIAHELIRLHGGTLEASSPPAGPGSVLTVTIPLLNAGPPAR